VLYTFYKQIGSRILVRYKTEDDPLTKTKIIKNYQPTLYTKSDEATGITSIYSYNLKPVQLESIKAAKSFADQYKGVDNFVLEGNNNYANQFMIDLYEGQSPDYSDDKIRYGAIDIEVFSEDGFPYPEQAEWPINGITVYDSIERVFYLFGLKHKPTDTWNQLKSDKAVKNLSITYFEFETEEDLLRSYLSHMHDHQYDLITGWNSEGFDLPYIVNRCNKLFGEKYTAKMLSPFGMINIREVTGTFGKTQQQIEVVGLPHLDYMQVYKKHTYTPREAYSLNFIGHAELGEKKLSYEEAGDLQDLYKSDYQKFLDYNVQDVNLIVRLEEKLGLFSLVYAMTYYTLSNFEDTMGTVKIWEQLIAKFLYNKNQTPLFRHQKKEDRDFEGAFVKEPVPGFYDWVVSSDLNSLYPHLEQQWNIGPETHVGPDELPEELAELRDKYTFNDVLTKKADLSALQKHGVTMAANFEFYRTDQMSFFSEIKRDLYAQRKVFKKKMLEAQRDKVAESDPKLKTQHNDLESKYNNMQMGLKILLNGGYGALGNKHFLYYMVENAEAITLSGQLVNKWTCEHVNKQLKAILNTKREVWAYSDTDSGYFTLVDFVKTLPKEYDLEQTTEAVIQFYDQIMDPMITDRCQELSDYMNCYEQRMFWDREIVANKAIWIARKKYVMTILDSEGTRYTKGEPKLKIMGMESVKSSTPEWSRKLLKEMYHIALTADEETLQERYATIYDDFMGYDINTIAIPSGVNGLEKYYDKDNLFKSGAPKHVKACLVHNKMVADLGLKKIQPIEDGSKIKFIELKLPNPTGHPAVAFDTYLPKEFGVEEYVDRDAIFERSFVKPLKIFLESIKWEPEYVNTLF